MKRFKCLSCGTEYWADNAAPSIDAAAGQRIYDPILMIRNVTHDTGISDDGYYSVLCIIEEQSNLYFTHPSKVATKMDQATRDQLVQFLRKCKAYTSNRLNENNQSCDEKIEEVKKTRRIIKILKWIRVFTRITAGIVTLVAFAGCVKKGVYFSYGELFAILIWISAFILSKVIMHRKNDIADKDEVYWQKFIQVTGAPWISQIEKIDELIDLWNR